ncbi:unnamed protein product, partial [Mesorhabditis spiculigera]
MIVLSFSIIRLAVFFAALISVGLAANGDPCGTSKDGVCPCGCIVEAACTRVKWADCGIPVNMLCPTGCSLDTSRCMFYTPPNCFGYPVGGICPVGLKLMPNGQCCKE